MARLRSTPSRGGRRAQAVVHRRRGRSHPLPDQGERRADLPFPWAAFRSPRGRTDLVRATGAREEDPTRDVALAKAPRPGDSGEVRVRLWESGRPVAKEPSVAFD